MNRNQQEGIEALRWDPSPASSHGTPPIQVAVAVQPVFKNTNRQDATLALFAGLVIGFAAAMYVQQEKDGSLKE